MFPKSNNPIFGLLLRTLLFLLSVSLQKGWLTYENVDQFLSSSSKGILISVVITGLLALSYLLYVGVRHLLTDFSLKEKKILFIISFLFCLFLHLFLSLGALKNLLLKRVSLLLSRIGLKAGFFGFILGTFSFLVVFFQDADIMAHFGASGSASSNRDNMESRGGGSSSGSGWTSFDLSVLAESSAEANALEGQNHHENRESASAPEAQHRNRNAESSHRCPFDTDEMIGGDSIEKIKRRLLRGNQSPSAFDLEMAKMKAEDLFEVKVKIIRTMTPLHPEGDWLRRGARALDNSRTSTGEESLEKLHDLLRDLQENGMQSQTFHTLKRKVFLRIDDIDSDSEIH